MTSHPIDPLSTSGAGSVPGVLDRIRGEVRGLGGTLWAARSPAELMDGVVAVESLKSVLDAVELAMVRELEATSAVKAVGWASTGDFVTAVAGGTKASGPATVRLAAAVDRALWRRSRRRWPTGGSPPPRPR